MGKKKKKLCYSVVPTAAGEALYKQLKSTTALQNLGVGDDMLEHKGTSELLDTAVKAVEKAKKEKEKLKNEKDKKDAKVPGGRGHQPSTPWKNHRGGGTGVEDVDVVVLDAVMVGRLLIPFRLCFTRGGMEVAVATPMLLDHLRTSMVDIVSTY